MGEPAEIPVDVADESWMDKLSFDEKTKRPEGCLKNAYLFLNNLPEWEGVIALNEFTGAIECRKPPPFDTEGGRPWSDIDDSNTAVLLDDKQACRVHTRVIAEAVQMVAHENAFHPPRDYLTALGWDGKARLNQFLRDYFGAVECDADSSLHQIEVASTN